MNMGPRIGQVLTFAVSHLGPFEINLTRLSHPCLALEFISPSSFIFGISSETNIDEDHIVSWVELLVSTFLKTH